MAGFQSVLDAGRSKLDGSLRAGASLPPTASHNAAMHTSLFLPPEDASPQCEFRRQNRFALSLFGCLGCGLSVAALCRFCRDRIGKSDGLEIGLPLAPFQLGDLSRDIRIPVRRAASFGLLHSARIPGGPINALQKSAARSRPFARWSLEISIAASRTARFSPVDFWLLRETSIDPKVERSAAPRDRRCGKEGLLDLPKIASGGRSSC